MKIAIVTGASSGMGREFVKQISENYKCLDEIWVIGRNADKLCDVQKDVRIKLRILPMNLRKKEAMERLRHALDTRQPRIKILVNCAGMGVIGDFSQLSLNAQRETVRLNCEALTAVTYVCLPYMHRRTRIIQMSSASAFVPQPGFAIYAASKSYVLSFSRALRAELKDKGITVTCVCPGSVDTPFYRRAEKIEVMPAYKKWTMEAPADVVAKAIRDGAAGRSLSIYGWSMKLFFLLCKIVPHPVIIAAAARLDT